MASVIGDANVDALLENLHAASAAQDEEIERYFFHERTGPWNGMEPGDHAFMASKLVALDREMPENLLCRARPYKDRFADTPQLPLSSRSRP
jgi:hypothetical protein